jgi:glycosyltransferase involved in cell wall biosynthesis
MAKVMNVLVFRTSASKVVVQSFQGSDTSVCAVGVEGTGEYDVTYRVGEDSIHDVLRRLPKDWQPDVILIATEYYDDPLAIEESPVPTVALFSDCNLRFDVMRRVAPCVDLVIATEEAQIEPLRAFGANRVAAMNWFFLDEERFRPLPCEKVYDVAFIGNLSPQVQRRRGKALERLLKLSDRFRVHVACGIYGEDYVRALCQAKIVFNQSIRGEVNMRVYEAMGCGVMTMLEDDNQQARQFFRDREHLVLYNDDNLEDLIAYYLTHGDEREAIADAGRAQVLARHTHRCRHEQVMSLIRAELLGDASFDPSQRNALRQSPAEREWNAARTLFWLGQYEPTLALLFRRTIGDDAPSALANDLGVVHAQAGMKCEQPAMLASAMTWLQRAVELDSSDALAAFNLFRVRFAPMNGGHQQRPREAAEYLRDFVRRLEANVTQTDSLRHDELRVNENALRFPLESDRLNNEWQQVLMTHCHDADTRRKELARLLLWKACDDWGDALAAMGQWGAARHAYEKSLTCLPDDGYVTYKLAQLHRAVGDVQTALRHLRRAVAREPFFFAALYDLATLLRETGQRVEAAAICREVVGWQVPYPDERRAAFAELLWQCVDTDRYDPNKVTPYPLADKRGFAFLSVFEWSERASWDVLLRAYLETFRADEDVTLILRTYHPHINVWDALSDYVTSLGCDPDHIPDILLIDEEQSTDALPSLYAAADAFVLLSREKDCVLRSLEAMAMGLPTIAARCGNDGLMNDENSYPVDVGGALESTKRLMRRVFENRDEAREKGRRAREEALQQRRRN